MNRFIILFLLILLPLFLNARQRSDTVNVFQQDTALRCHIDSIALDAGPGFSSYQWSTGETTRLIWVENTGTYTVVVNNGSQQEDYCYLNIIKGKIEQQSETACYQDVILNEIKPDLYRYLWNTGDTTNFIIDTLTASTTYTVIIKDVNNLNTCYDSVSYDLYPRLFVDFEQPNKLCPDGPCKGQVKATASGGLPPYHYLWQNAAWDPGDSSFAIGLCPGEYAIEISDEYGCTFDTSHVVELFDLPELEIEHEPDTVYIENPKATFFFTNLSEDSIQLTTWSWNFGDGGKSDLASPVHYYLSTGVFDAYFKYTTVDGCVDSVLFQINVKEVELDIPNVFTPNGDGINDYFEIRRLENYVGNELVIFNRWGKKVYESQNYNNKWDGDNLKDGVYYYVLKCQGFFENDEFYGAIMILGKEK